VIERCGVQSPLTLRLEWDGVCVVSAYDLFATAGLGGTPLFCFPSSIPHSFSHVLWSFTTKQWLFVNQMVMYRSLPTAESEAVLESGMGAFLGLGEEEVAPREQEALAHAFFAAMQPARAGAGAGAGGAAMDDDEDEAGDEGEAEGEGEEEEDAPDPGMTDD
jgi:hypothetical protein